MATDQIGDTSAITPPPPTPTTTVAAPAAVAPPQPAPAPPPEIATTAAPTPVPVPSPAPTPQPPPTEASSPVPVAAPPAQPAISAPQRSVSDLPESGTPQIVAPQQAAENVPVAVSAPAPESRAQQPVREEPLPSTTPVAVPVLKNPQETVSYSESGRTRFESSPINTAPATEESPNQTITVTARKRDPIVPLEMEDVALNSAVTPPPIVTSAPVEARNVPVELPVQPKKEPELVDPRSDDTGYGDFPPPVSRSLSPPTKEPERIDTSDSQPGQLLQSNPDDDRRAAPPPPQQIITARGKPIPDWRFKISLADSATYFYNEAQDADILYPLKQTGGVIFPYTPTINVTYNANYESNDLTHSNYKIHTYKNSSVENITIIGDFTAQDSYEAEYILAVIHFFRCATKMFYGKDSAPRAGTPPPLCYLTGHGAYGFDKHPVVISSFTLNYPNDVDYISTRNDQPDSILPLYNKPIFPTSPSLMSRMTRLLKSGLEPGGKKAPDAWGTLNKKISDRSMTRVPSKIQLTINALPIVTRNNISNNFSLKDYARGELLMGSFKQGGGTGGIW